jgi:hypothetical protein
MKENKEAKPKKKVKDKESRKSSISLNHDFLERKREKESKKEISNMFKPKIIF